MVNRQIVEYLKKGIERGFSVERLRKELVKGGFHIRDIEEAAFVFEQERKMHPPENISKAEVEKKAEPRQKVSEIPAKNLPKPKEQKMIGSGGTKWMKIAGWIGIVLFALSAIGFSWMIMSQDGFVQKAVVNAASSGGSTQTDLGTGGIVIAISILVLMLVLYVLHFYGYARLGRHIESKSLKFFGWAMILLPVVIGVWFGATIFIILRAIGEGSIYTTQNDPTLILVILQGIFLIYLFILQIVFATGMIKAGKQVKFASLTGIFVLIYFLLSLAFIGFGIYQGVSAGADAFANPLSTNQTLESLEIMNYILLGANAVGLLVILLGSMALINASKKFE